MDILLTFIPLIIDGAILFGIIFFIWWIFNRKSKEKDQMLWQLIQKNKELEEKIDQLIERSKKAEPDEK